MYHHLQDFTRVAVLTTKLRKYEVAHVSDPYILKYLEK